MFIVGKLIFYSKGRNLYVSLISGTLFLSSYLSVRDINSDFVDYKLYYLNTFNGNANLNTRVHELLYQSFQELFINMGVDQYWIVYLFNIELMILPVFIGIYLLRMKPSIKVYLVMAYFIANLWLIGGCLRQMIAVGLFFLSVVLCFTLDKKKLWLPIFLMVCAGLFHRSGFIALALVALFYFSRIPKQRTQLIILLLCFYVAKYIVPYIDMLVFNVATILGHDYYVENAEELETQMVQKMSDIGTYIIIIKYFFYTCFYNKMRRFYSGVKDFDVVYNIAFWGMAIGIITMNISTIAPIARANYFGFFTNLSIALLLYAATKARWKESPLIIAVILVGELGVFYNHIMIPFYPGLMPLNFIF